MDKQRFDVLSSSGGQDFVGRRLVALDALRGVAALSVVLFHTYTFSGLPSLLDLPGWADAMFRGGSLGVEVFFVLSGVVITLSIADDEMSLGYLGRFALRRSVRLDPPYWTALAIACLLLTFRGTPPHAASIMAHVVYAQNIFGFQNIVSQFWTLCYEIQFYLVLCGLAWLAQGKRKLLGSCAAGILFLLSLQKLVTHDDASGWFIDWWWAFAAGTATAMMLLRRLALLVWGSVVLLVLVAGFLIKSPAPIAVAVTAGGIGLTGLGGGLVTWSGGAVLQWLGRNSYSLYLFHFFGANAAKVGSNLIASRSGGWILFTGSAAISLLVAELAYRFIERPSRQISRRIGLGLREPWLLPSVPNRG